MLRRCYFISHPNVVISKDVPVPRWPLSDLGRQRMRVGLAQPWIGLVAAIYSSTEQKAIDAAEILAQHLNLGYLQVEELGENDRTATGFLPADAFEAMADAFFAHPDQSVRGWERASDAQARILHAVTTIAAHDTTDGAIAIVSHGAVGTLLYCALTGKPISRAWDQPPTGGGNFFAFHLAPPVVHGHWQPLDELYMGTTTISC